MKKFLTLLAIIAALVLALSACGGNTPTEHTHNFTEWELILRPTCTENGEKERYCACGEKQIASVLSLGHTEVVDKAVEPTCTATGLTEGKHCSVCNEVVVAQETVAALGHTEVIDAAIAATCTATGFTEGKHCSVCDEVLVAQTVVAANGHNYSNGVCSGCGDKYYSVGLKFTSNGDGTWYVSEIGDCTDTDIVIPSTLPNGDSVTSIGERAFWFCDSPTSVVIPDSVTSIGHSAFRSCSSLTSVVIPDSVTSIGDSAFDGCSSLTSVVIPDSVTSIGDYAFYGCFSLTSVIIGDSVTSIGDYAFGGCYNLTSVVIPNSVTSIGDYAFSSCESLTDVYYTGSEAEWNGICIDNGNENLINTTIHYNYEG